MKNVSKIKLWSESNFHPIVNVINRVGNDDLILSFVFHTGLFPGTNRRVKT
jgi:hypothetical protein